MKKSMDVLIWAFLLFLITPSGMALASWNAVPGDYTYAWKLSLEKVLLLVLSPSDKLQSSTQVKIAERRFGEMEQVLDSQYAVEGLDNLNKQLAVTSTDIQKINKDASRSEVTDQYIVSLKKMSVSLEEQKAKAKTGEIAIVAQKNDTSKPANNKPATKPTAKPISKPAANNPVATVTPVVPGTPTTQVSSALKENTSSASKTEVISAIEETQNNIEQAIKILQQNQQNNLIQGNSTGKGDGNSQQQPLQGNNGMSKKDDGEDKGDENNSDKNLIKNFEENKNKNKSNGD